ncbi:MAG: hypothetical protein EA397_13215 [Deltaproteobacteria bacterium]|nr:MAG: hypothetical protein EA397_13215 [Deltaproteobacteria bacterium]
MGIRSTLASVIGGEQVEARLRDLVEGILASKSFARPADLQEMRDRLAALEGGSTGSASDLAPRVKALETDNASLRKKIDLLRGAVDAATSQLSEVRKGIDDAHGEARKALSRAESALATAESLSDGIEELERVTDASSGADSRIDLNVATVDQLEGLSGIGPSMAQRIVDNRDEKGPFHKVSDLSRVKGLGAATVKKLDAFLRV